MSAAIQVPRLEGDSGGYMLFGNGPWDYQAARELLDSLFRHYKDPTFREELTQMAIEINRSHTARLTPTAYPERPEQVVLA